MKCFLHTKIQAILFCEPEPTGRRFYRDRLLKGLNDNKKTPGDGGFTKEFYEALFELLGDRMLNSFKEVSFGKGKLSIISQRRGVISLKCL